MEVIGAGGLDLGYEFDAAGNLLRLRTADQAEPPQRRYAHDGLNRLTETRDGATDTLLQAYACDQTGNRTSATVGGTTTAYSTGSNSHRLTAVGATARSYDAAGNTTVIGTNKSFVYDDLGRLRQTLDAGVAIRNYAYNGLGQQVRRWAANDDRYSLYGDGGEWLGEYDTNGGAQQQIVWFAGLPVAVLTGSGPTQRLHYIEADALGTPRVVVDPSRGSTGTPIWRWDLTGEAFGNTPPNEDPDGDGIAFVFNMRFPGQRYDSASGLNYNYFRDYDPSTGRYVQSDPIGLDGGISTFSYANSSPLNSMDFDGLQAVVLPWVQPITAPRPITAPLDPFIGVPPSTPNDPFSEYCRSLARKIANSKDEIYKKRWPDLLQNVLNLPWRIGPGERLRDTGRGHEKILNRRLRELRNLEDEYDSNCKGPIACTADDTSSSVFG